MHKLKLLPLQFNNVVQKDYKTVHNFINKKKIYSPTVCSAPVCVVSVVVVPCSPSPVAFAPAETATAVATAEVAFTSLISSLK